MSARRRRQQLKAVDFRSWPPAEHNERVRIRKQRQRLPIWMVLPRARNGGAK